MLLSSDARAFTLFLVVLNLYTRNCMVAVSDDHGDHGIEPSTPISFGLVGVLLVLKWPSIKLTRLK